MHQRCFVAGGVLGASYLEFARHMHTDTKLDAQGRRGTKLYVNYSYINGLITIKSCGKGMQPS